MGKRMGDCPLSKNGRIPSLLSRIYECKFLLIHFYYLLTILGLLNHIWLVKYEFIVIDIEDLIKKWLLYFFIKLVSLTF